jgi:malate synthase
MRIHALNPGPDGRRAVGYLDDDEDSGGHTLADTLQAAWNRTAALYRDLFDTPFLADLFRRLVAVCARHGAVAIGGMATALPGGDAEVDREAAAAIRADKEWEAAAGFRRGWVAHIHHMGTAAAPFVERWREGAPPPPSDPERFPLRIETPAGRVTEDGTRRNLRVLLEYLEGWLRGRGAKGIDSLAGRPGRRPALMEDLATARISVAQTAQRLRHGALCADSGRRHDVRLVRRLLDEELADILARLPAGADPGARERYEASRGIALAWLRRYLELDFTSLGAFTRAQLLAQASARDPL